MFRVKFGQMRSISSQSFVSEFEVRVLTPSGERVWLEHNSNVKT